MKPKPEVLKFKEIPLTKQQAQLFANASARVASAQEAVNLLSGAFLAGAGVEAWTQAQLNWENPDAPRLRYFTPPPTT